MSQLDLVVSKVQQFIEQTNLHEIRLDDPFVFQLMLLNHAVIVSNIVYGTFKKLKQPVPFVAGFLITLALGFGGGITTNLILGNKQSLLESDTFILYFLAVWSLIYFSPFGLLHKLTGNFLVELVTYAVQGLFVSSFAIGGVDRAVKAFPASNIGPVIIGTLATTAGGFLFSFLMNQYLGKPTLGSELSKPGAGIFLALTANAFYYTTNYVKEQTVVYTHTQKNIRVDITASQVVRGIYVLLFLYLWTSKYLFAASAPEKKQVQPASAPAESQPVAASTVRKSKK